MIFTVECEHGVKRTVEIEDGREHPPHPSLIRSQLEAVALGCPRCYFDAQPVVRYMSGTTEREIA